MRQHPPTQFAHKLFFEILLPFKYKKVRRDSSSQVLWNDAPQKVFRRRLFKQKYNVLNHDGFHVDRHLETDPVSRDGPFDRPHPYKLEVEHHQLHDVFLCIPPS